MITLDLTDWLSLEIYRVLLVFVRITAAFLLMPGFGEPTVPARIRILVGLAIAAAVSPAIIAMPTAVPNVWGILLGVAAEATSGALLGAIARTIISGVLIAGQVIGQNIGLANVFATGMIVDQAATIGAAVYAGLLATLFASGGHLAILRALVGSYSLIPPAHFPSVDATAHSIVEAGLRSFHLAIQLTFPFLLLAFVFNVMLGAMNRALPAIPVFMIASPALVAAGLYLLAATMPGILDASLTAWTDVPSLLTH
jgi:flagellar biosynthetic protein FliR